MEHKSPHDLELTAQGWVRQFSATSPRLEEAVEAYKEMGHEVLLEPVDTRPASDACSEEESCTACLGPDPEFVKVIYTRPVGEGSHPVPD